MRSNSSFLTLLVSFCLTTGSYFLAQTDDVPVQHLVFDDYVVEGYVQTLEFDDYVVKIVRDEERSDVIVMDEYVVVSQVDPTDDGDGENIDMMNKNWCLIHPDDVICQDEDQGGDEEEEGC